MSPFMEDVRFAVLSANIRPDDSLAATFGVSCQPYKIFTRGGEKVGVVGYTSQETPALSRPGKSRFIISRAALICPTKGQTATRRSWPVMAARSEVKNGIFPFQVYI